MDWTQAWLRGASCGGCKRTSAAEQITSSRRQLAQSKSRGMTNTKSQQDCERSRARVELLCAAVPGSGVPRPRRGSGLHQIEKWQTWHHVQQQPSSTACRTLTDTHQSSVKESVVFGQQDGLNQQRNGKTGVNFDVKFEMSRQCAPTRTTTRPFCTGALQRQWVRDATRGRCESGARVRRRQGLKGREDSTGSADRSINRAELAGRCPLTMRHLVKSCSNDYKSQKSQICSNVGMSHFLFECGYDFSASRAFLVMSCPSVYNPVLLFSHLFSWRLLAMEQMCQHFFYKPFLRIFVLLTVSLLTLREQVSAPVRRRRKWTKCSYNSRSCRCFCLVWPGSKIVSRRSPRQLPVALRKIKMLNKLLAASQPEESEITELRFPKKWRNLKKLGRTFCRILKYQRRPTSNHAVFRRIRREHCRFWSGRWRVTKDADFTTACPECFGGFGETRCNGRAGKESLRSHSSEGQKALRESRCIVFTWARKFDK